MPINKILLAIGAIIGIFVILFIVYQLTNTSPNMVFPQMKTVNADDHIKWSPDKKYILVEYSDFQCPACAATHQQIKQQIEASSSANYNLTKKITFIYRNYPLTQTHQNSQSASYAAEAANKQGKYFEMSDKLFETQKEWGELPNPLDYFIGLGKQLNLNSNQLKIDMNSQSVKDKITKDIASGDTTQLNSTPTFFLNGKKLEITTFDYFINELKNIK
ncbi:MAG: thioredoxin domain-containing protein [bacterium]|nr:thioredoxin domain-containing protein [bacterium]